MYPRGESLAKPSSSSSFVNDAVGVLLSFSSVYLATYADHATALFATFSSVEASSATECDKLQVGVNNQAQWCATLKIQFEPSKWLAMVISHRRNCWATPQVIFNSHIVDDGDISPTPDQRSTPAHHCCYSRTAHWVLDKVLHASRPPWPECCIIKASSMSAALSPGTRLFTPIVPRRSLHISFYYLAILVKYILAKKFDQN